MNLKKILSALVAGTMALSTLSMSVFADIQNESYVTTGGTVTVKGDETVYNSLTEAAASTVTEGGVKTYTINGNVEYVTGTDLAAGAEKVVITGKGELTLTTYYHLGITANGADLEISEVQINDKSDLSNTENALSAWEFAYICFDGTESITLTNVTFTEGVQLWGEETATITGCTFDVDVSSRYSLWVATSGKVEVIDSNFTGTRGIKTHADYDSEDAEIDLSVEKCTFNALTEKPALVHSNNAGGTVSLEDNNYNNCTKGLFAIEAKGEITGSDLNDIKASVTNAGETTYYLSVEDAAADAGDAEVVKPIAEVNEKPYFTLQEAIAAAETDDIITILENGTMAMPSIKGKTLTIKAAEGVDFEFTVNTGIGFNGSSITFENVSFKYTNANYTGLQHAADMVYNNCTFSGMPFLYGASDTFNTCTFIQESSNAYNVWTYGSKLATFNNCIFKSAGRALYAYAEGNIIDKVIVKDCKFYATEPVEGKAAVETSHVMSPMTVEIVNTTAEGFGTGDKSGNSLYNHKDSGKAGCKNIIIAVDDEIVVYENNTGVKVAALIGVDTYDSLQDAINAAKPGETIVMQSDVEENITVGETAVALMSEEEGITLDLNGKTLTGSIYVNANETIEIKNGSIVKTDFEEPSAIESAGGNVTLTDVNVTSARHAVRIEGGNAVINSGNYKVSGTAGMTTHALYVSDDAQVKVNGGTFVGALGTASESGIPVFASGSDTLVEIYDGYFTNGKDVVIGNINGDGNITIYGGLYGKSHYNKQPHANYIADGYEVIDYDHDTYKYKVVKTAQDTTGISVYFRPTTDERVYDIILKADENQEIYEWATADLTFEISEGTVTYEIAANTAENINLTDEGDGRYMFSMDGYANEKNNGYEITGAEIKIGTVTFGGYGTFDFNVKAVDENVVMATEVADSIAKEFTVGGKNKLTIDADDIGTDTDDIADDLYGKIVGEKIEIPTQKLTINVAFPNKINDNKASYQAMTVTISGGDLEADKVIYLGSDAENENTDAVAEWDDATKTYEIVVADELTTDRTYNVTVSGEGYRTARYAVKMDAEKTLNFWNNVKDVAEKVEEGNEASKENVTFLAGEIVKDNVINVYDLSAVVSYFGSASDENNGLVEYDLNRDKNIDSRDVAYVLVSWGK